mgnify:CR=1 FL=1
MSVGIQFSEEGKNGHRKCNVSTSDSKSRSHCGRRNCCSSEDRQTAKVTSLEDERQLNQSRYRGLRK